MQERSNECHLFFVYMAAKLITLPQLKNIFQRLCHANITLQHYSASRRPTPLSEVARITKPWVAVADEGSTL